MKKVSIFPVVEMKKGVALPNMNLWKKKKNLNTKLFPQLQYEEQRVKDRQAHHLEDCA